MLSEVEIRIALLLLCHGALGFPAAVHRTSVSDAGEEKTIEVDEEVMPGANFCKKAPASLVSRHSRHVPMACGE